MQHQTDLNTRGTQNPVALLGWIRKSSSQVRYEWISTCTLALQRARAMRQEGSCQMSPARLALTTR